MLCLRVQLQTLFMPPIPELDYESRENSDSTPGITVIELDEADVPDFLRDLMERMSK
jgi:hypothetical protein